MKILLATRNQHKVQEIHSVIEEVPFDLKLVGLEEIGLEYSECEEALEPYETFEENATSKARYFARLSGLPTIADDSGLEVDLLEGDPGVKSKRFSNWSEDDGISRDESNNNYLIDCLRHFSGVKWNARYVCVAVFISGRQVFMSARGEVQGRIIASAKGSEGFGYDPHFLADGSNLTFGQISENEKNCVSHRGKAFQNLIWNIHNAQ